MARKTPLGSAGPTGSVPFSSEGCEFKLILKNRSSGAGGTSQHKNGKSWMYAALVFRGGGREKHRDDKCPNKVGFYVLCFCCCVCVFDMLCGLLFRCLRGGRRAGRRPAPPPARGPRERAGLVSSRARRADGSAARWANGSAAPWSNGPMAQGFNGSTLHGSMGRW